MELLSNIHPLLMYADTGLADAFIEIIGKNSIQWRKNKPLKCVDKFGTERGFATLYANIEKRNDIKILPESLYYDTVTFYEAEAIWSLGLIFYKIQTVRESFHTLDNGNLALNNEFSKLYNLSSDYSVCIVMGEISGMVIIELQK